MYNLAIRYRVGFKTIIEPKGKQIKIDIDTYQGTMPSTFWMASICVIYNLPIANRVGFEMSVGQKEKELKSTWT